MTKVYFATNRNKLRSGKFGQRFNSDGPHFYVVGRAEVTWNRVGANGEVLDWDDFEVSWELAREQRPRAQDITGIPEMHVKEEVGSRLGSTEIFREVRAKMKEDGRDAIIFIHGFANDFESSIGRAAQLAETYTISHEAAATPYKPYVFAFSWPSNGKVFPPWEYASDRNDAALSGLAMARALRRFVDFLNVGQRCKGRRHLVCHSMGNWALRHAVLG